MTKAERPRRVLGEFEVVEVREVEAEEYSRLAPLLYRPQTPKPGERRWIIRFEQFNRYLREVPQTELSDVRTAKSVKPISEWTIVGLVYIDDQALEGIRRKAGGYEEGSPVTASPMTSMLALEDDIKNIKARLSQIESVLGIAKLPFSLSHECIEHMLLEIGRYLGSKVYTADPSRTCGNVKLIFYW